MWKRWRGQWSRLIKGKSLTQQFHPQLASHRFHCTDEQHLGREIQRYKKFNLTLKNYKELFIMLDWLPLVRNIWGPISLKSLLNPGFEGPRFEGNFLVHKPHVEERYHMKSHEKPEQVSWIRCDVMDMRGGGGAAGQPGAGRCLIGRREKHSSDFQREKIW